MEFRTLPPPTNVHAFPNTQALAASLWKRINESFDLHFAVRAIFEATQGEFYIYGGTLRRVLLNDAI